MEELRGDYLILLVGTNPIPNYIISFGYAKECSNIYLLHTSNQDNGFIGTENIAKNIKSMIEQNKKGVKVILKSCDKSNGGSIEKTIEEILYEIDKDEGHLGKTIHLNYTGGTKAMAAYAYNTVKKYEEKAFGNYRYVYSYVDSEINKVVCEVNGQLISEDFNKISQLVKPSIGDICNIHGYSVKYSKRNITEDNIEILYDAYITQLYKEDNNPYEFDYMILKDFDTYCIRKTNNTGKSDCKMDLFILKDNATRICGDQARICLISDIKGKDVLSREVEDFYRIRGSDNIKVFGDSEHLGQNILSWVRRR